MSGLRAVPAHVRLVLATGNEHKVGELRAILTGDDGVPGLAGDQLCGSRDLGAPEPVEDGATFAQNALIKARALAAVAGVPVIADDSGLAVDIMGGAPGIFSARWCGRHGDDQANLDLLVAQLADVPEAHRRAAFVCAAVLVTPEGDETVEIATMPGVLARAPRGLGGFGYDPLLIPDGYDVTSAELSAAQKNRISHRGKAFRALVPAISAAVGGR